jgi:hypothetical protein
MNSEIFSILSNAVEPWLLDLITSAFYVGAVIFISAMCAYSSLLFTSKVEIFAHKLFNFTNVTKLAAIGVGLMTPMAIPFFMFNDTGGLKADIYEAVFLSGALGLLITISCTLSLFANPSSRTNTSNA